MKLQEKRKEILTVHNIQKDLRYEMKDICLWSIFPMIIITLLLAAAFGLPAEAVLYKIVAVGCAVIMLGIMLPEVIMLIRLHKAWQNTPCIVKDKLVGMKSYYRRAKDIRRAGRYRFEFSGYGTYSVPAENYTWSEMFSASSETVYKRSAYGEEFYLVLSKPHNGKILLAYNAELFRLEGEETTDT